jgi:hypothetical protein
LCFPARLTPSGRGGGGGADDSLDLPEPTDDELEDAADDDAPDDDDFDDTDDDDDDDDDDDSAEVVPDVDADPARRAWRFDEDLAAEIAALDGSLMEIATSPSEASDPGAPGTLTGADVSITGGVFA